MSSGSQNTRKRTRGQQTTQTTSSTTSNTTTMQAADPNAQAAVAQPAPGEDRFVQDPEAGDSAEDDEDEAPGKGDKKAGRRKIKIEFIQDKSRRHITFSKRKAGQRVSETLLFCVLLPFLRACLFRPARRVRVACPYQSQRRAPSTFFYSKIFTMVIVTDGFACRHHEKSVRAFHAHRHPSPSPRRLRNRPCLHLHHRQAPTSRHPTRGQEPHPSMPQRPTRRTPLIHARRPAAGPPIPATTNATPSSPGRRSRLAGNAPGHVGQPQRPGTQQRPRRAFHHRRRRRRG
jgi:hypothetical protein